MRVRNRLLFATLGLCLVLATPGMSRAQHDVDKYEEFLSNNQALVQDRLKAVNDIINFLKANGVPVYRWDCTEHLKVRNVTLGTPTCGDCSGGPGPVVNIRTCYNCMPQGYIKAYVFGILYGPIIFGTLQEWPDVTGNVFAGSISEGEGGCYAQTSLGLWSHETCTEFLLPGPNGPFIKCDKVFYVLASDFRGAPENAHRQFQQMFYYLTSL